MGAEAAETRAGVAKVMVSSETDTFGRAGGVVTLALLAAAEIPPFCCPGVEVGNVFLGNADGNFLLGTVDVRVSGII